MKLKIMKTGNEIDVCFFNADSTTSEFSYIEMVNRLYNDKEAEEPIFEGDFTDDEKLSITSLISDINTKCLETTESFVNVSGFVDED